MTRFRQPEEFEEYEDVKFGAVSRSGKAVKCTFEDGTVRWVPVSQIEDGCDYEEGRVGTLSVTKWIVDQWAQEDPAERQKTDRSALVSIPGGVALRETAKGLQVRAGDAEPVWLARSQIPDESEVRFDGDRGTLLLPRWIAEEKGLVVGPEKPRTVADDAAEVFNGDEDIPF